MEEGLMQRVMSCCVVGCGYRVLVAVVVVVS